MVTPITKYALLAYEGNRSQFDPPVLSNWLCRDSGPTTLRRLKIYREARAIAIDEAPALPQSLSDRHPSSAGSGLSSPSSDNLSQARF